VLILCSDLTSPALLFTIRPILNLSDLTTSPVSSSCQRIVLAGFINNISWIILMQGATRLTETADVGFSIWNSPGPFRISGPCSLLSSPPSQDWLRSFASPGDRRHPTPCRGTCIPAWAIFFSFLLSFPGPLHSPGSPLHMAAPAVALGTCAFLSLLSPAVSNN
jgi:hypothetical protein